MEKKTKFCLEIWEKQNKIVVATTTLLLLHMYQFGNLDLDPFSE